MVAGSPEIPSSPALLISPETPVVVIGSGPIGLAAAAHLQVHGLPHRVLEAGNDVAAAVRSWGHVRLFSPWAELIDPVAADLLAAHEWTRPSSVSFPTGAEWVDAYLAPLAEVLSVDVETGMRVTAISRRGRDVLADRGRHHEPLVVHVEGPDGPVRIVAAAVIDASGTLATPNPMGSDGLPALGEHVNADRIDYGMPDLDDPAVAERHLRRHTVVVGAGDSALTSILALAHVVEANPTTRVSWVVRGAAADSRHALSDDPLSRRAGLAVDASAAVAAGRVEVVDSFRIEAIVPDADGAVRLRALDGREVTGVDRVIAATGYRPDVTMTRELRLDIDAATEAPNRLAPLIDPNMHSCGSVPPHGVAQLSHPEPGYYAVGLKSYGRAPTFLALTGYEQVRSVVAHLAGDTEAAAEVRLVLPGVAVAVD